MLAVIVILTIIVMNVSTNTTKEGHLKPLGFQRKSEGHIDILEEVPDSKTFFEKYLKIGKPVVFKGAAKLLPAFSKWTDDYLSKEFGHILVDIEEGKKENRSLGAWRWPLEKFIKKYKQEDVYLVHTLPKEMWRDLQLLPCISCGGYSKVLKMLVMWFSSGGTKSVLHNDAIDNINCLFSGSKVLYMVDWKHNEFVKFDSPEGSFSNVNVDAVDLEKYPGLSKAPWWEAKMEAGDCLFIPYRWFHQVQSFADNTRRNMAVNIWFYHLRKINTSECKGDINQNNFVPFDGVDISSSNIEAVRFVLLLEIGENSHIPLKELFIQSISFYENGVTKAQLRKLQGILDKNKDRMVSVDEVNDLSVDELKMVSILFPGLYTENEEDEEYMPENDSDEFVDNNNNNNILTDGLDKVGDDVSGDESEDEEQLFDNDANEKDEL